MSETAEHLARQVEFRSRLARALAVFGLVVLGAANLVAFALTVTLLVRIDHIGQQNARSLAAQRESRTVLQHTVGGLLEQVGAEDREIHRLTDALLRAHGISPPPEAPASTGGQSGPATPAPSPQPSPQPTPALSPSASSPPPRPAPSPTCSVAPAINRCISPPPMPSSPPAPL